MASFGRSTPSSSARNWRRCWRIAALLAAGLALIPLAGCTLLRLDLFRPRAETEAARADPSTHAPLIRIDVRPMTAGQPAPGEGVWMDWLTYEAVLAGLADAGAQP